MISPNTTSHSYFLIIFRSPEYPSLTASLSGSKNVTYFSALNSTPLSRALEALPLPPSLKNMK